MKYIKIKNKGLIDVNALHLLGACTKRDEADKIGQFGSGNKYALAYFLRENYAVRIFSGLNEILITTKEETFREKKFNVIHINDQKTSITTDMGISWEFWQAIREIYSNALDEDEASMEYVQTIEPKENETHFYICNERDALKFIIEFDNYFAANKKVLFKCDKGKILQKTGKTANIYRRGINCFKTDKLSMYDYDIQDIQLDENRLVNYFWHVETKLWEIIFRCDNEEIIMNILHNCNNNYIEGSLSDYSSIYDSGMSDIFKKCLKNNKFAPHGMTGLLTTEELERNIIVPTKIFKSFRHHLSDNNIEEAFRVSSDGYFIREVEMQEKYKVLLKKAYDFLDEVNFDISYEVKLAVFENADILGHANNDMIYISEKGFEAGLNVLIEIMIEEYIHLKYDAKDCSRKFQNSIIKEFVNYMKEKNAYLL